jgi:hypothetical protein
MIKSYSDWQAVNEVDELTEFNLPGKYINNIIKAYENAPKYRPSRDVSEFQNTKGTQPLSTFVKGISSRKSAEIITSVINDWYKWPSESKTKSVLINYINNEDDLSNLAAMGLPFGKVFQADPILAIPSLKVLTKGVGKVGKGLFKMIPKLFMKESNSQVNKDQRLNEDFGATALAIGISILVGSLLSAGTKYTLYGKESVEDDLLFSWTTPYLPDIQGVAGDDPIIATYVAVFNTAMMLVYDAWNLCMGQEKYGEEKNPILSWQSGNNYINSYYKQFYENDPDIRSGFSKFMSDLRAACLSDMKNPEIFQKSPFYYTGDKVRVNFEGKDPISIAYPEWQKWVKDNYKNYILIPVSKTEFQAKEREGVFSPLSPLGITETPKGDPMRNITVQFPTGAISNLSLLELELWLLNPDNVKSYGIESQDVVTGGSSLILNQKEEVDSEEESKPNLPTQNPTIVEGSTLEQISTNIKSEDLESFVGMGNI